MTSTRRTLLAASLLTLPLARARAEGEDARMSERAIGNADAKVTVQEYFSLTCTHCAAFQKETFPKVKAELIDTGKIRYIWRDYPLDQLALYAAMVARALPPDRYEPFVSALLSTQDRWAFTRTANPVEELQKMALLAGLSRPTFDATVRDDKLKQFVLDEQAGGEKKYGVNSTPTFVFNDKPTPGAIPFDTFVKAVEAASA
ncbi:MAG: thioredoxin domain-containing protein [Acetobacteraceae bacterium]|nr:thioredoxin domain-containing protein [Acetobacteraceae bacterium]